MTSNVSNMQAARANKAMAFVTFFIFASTPIQSVMYDPATKQVTARFRLGDKTTLSVGSAGESKKGVGLKRRIGKGWMINSSVQQNNLTGTTSASTYMEWHKRY